MSLEGDLGLSEVLTFLDGQLVAHGRTTLITALRAGLPPARTREQLARVGLASAESLDEWFAWHDGVDVPESGIVDDLEIIPGFYPLSLDAALALRSDYLDDGAWPQSYVPIVTNGAGDHLVVDLDGRRDPAVRRWEFDEHDHPLVFASLATLVHTIDQCYARGVIVVDARGYLTMDQRRFDDLAAEVGHAVPSDEGPVRPLVQDLERLGRLPSDDEAEREPDRVRRWERGLTDLAAAGDLSSAEAVRLVALFSDDDTDGFGLAWTLLHLVESSPSWPFEPALDGASGPWADLLRRRAATR